jgi:hypothetical protein
MSEPAAAEVIAAAHALLARVFEIYRHEDVERVSKSEPESLLGRAKQLEAALAGVQPKGIVWNKPRGAAWPDAPWTVDRGNHLSRIWSATGFVGAIDEPYVDLVHASPRMLASLKEWFDGESAGLFADLATARGAEDRARAAIAAAEIRRAARSRPQARR